MTYDILIDGKLHRLKLEQQENTWLCTLDGREIVADAVLSRPNVISLLIDGKAWEVKREQTATDLHLWVRGARYEAEVRDPRSLRSRRAESSTDLGPKKVMAPMPGKVVRVLVQENEEVEAGQGLLVVEAMKMQNELKSPKKGTVRRLKAGIGTAVNAGDVLAVVE
jgi:biotin carboxyl carrier protein